MIASMYALAETCRFNVAMHGIILNVVTLSQSRGVLW